MAMNNLEGFVRQLVSLLRYFAAPVVAAIIAFVFDDKHDVFDAVLGGRGTLSFWLLTVFLAVLGILVYFTHRTAFHPLVTKAMVLLATRKNDHKPSVDDLAFERWRRRGAKDHTPERSSQAVLDEANAAGHFFYCSCWASVLLVVSLKAIFPTKFSLVGKGVWGFVATVVVLFVLGVINDWQTTKLDLKAYRRFKNKNQ